MAITTLWKVSVNVRLNDGTDAEGKARYVSISLGDLNEYNFDADKALTIVTALAPCLSKTISSVEETRLSYLTKS